LVALLYRPFVIGLPIALVACMNSAPTVADHDTAVPLGIDLGSSSPVAAKLEPQAQSHRTPAVEGHAAPTQHSGEMQMAHAGRNDAHGTGTVNSIDPAQHKVNLSHNPIPEIGWPAMTMDFPVAPSVDLRVLKPGVRVNFTIEQGQSGMYEIQAISPAGGGR
jgi:Cu(I)/Ag(I) efflux system periplasmic protein CusF